jgi:hypothetical protein
MEFVKGQGLLLEHLKPGELVGGYYDRPTHNVGEHLEVAARRFPQCTDALVELVS